MDTLNEAVKKAEESAEKAELQVKSARQETHVQKQRAETISREMDEVKAEYERKLRKSEWELAKVGDSLSDHSLSARQALAQNQQLKNELSETRLSLHKEARAALHAIEAKERLQEKAKRLERERLKVSDATRKPLPLILTQS